MEVDFCLPNKCLDRHKTCVKSSTKIFNCTFCALREIILENDYQTSQGYFSPLNIFDFSNCLCLQKQIGLLFEILIHYFQQIIDSNENTSRQL